MSKLGIVEAFRRYGARQANPQWAVTAVAGDGSLVVSCWQHLLSRPSRDVTVDGRSFCWKQRFGEVVKATSFRPLRARGMR